MRKNFNDKRMEVFKSKKLSVISDFIKETLEALEKGKVNKNFDSTMDMMKDLIKYIFNEEITIEEEILSKNTKDITIFCMEETILVFEVEEICIKKHNELDDLDLANAPEEIKKDLKDFLEELMYKLN